LGGNVRQPQPRRKANAIAHRDWDMLDRPEGGRRGRRPRRCNASRRQRRAAEQNRAPIKIAGNRRLRVPKDDLAATSTGIHQNSSIPVHQKMQPFGDNQSFLDEQVGRACGS
jgi:hypothetical protein